MQKRLLVPQICRNSSLLVTVIISQLMVTVAWLINFEDNEWQVFGLWSFYTLWIVMLTCLFLCLARERIAKQSRVVGILSVFSIGLVVLAVVDFIASVYLGKMQTGLLVWEFNWSRFARLAIVDVILVAIFIRFASFLAIVEKRNKAESEARIQALQSRIQPHFLFNSLNTISELTATNPSKAEEAIQALSMLFRVSLEEGSSLHSLEKEIRLCRRYLELEMWRYGSRVEVKWEINVKNQDKIIVPKLILQPLLENAIKYSVDSQTPEKKVIIEISVRDAYNYLSIKVVNPVASSDVQNDGHGIAINNIKERLVVLYDDKQSFKVRSNSDFYQVIIKIPK